MTDRDPTGPAPGDGAAASPPERAETPASGTPAAGAPAGESPAEAAPTAEIPSVPAEAPAAMPPSRPPTWVPAPRLDTGAPDSSPTAVLPAAAPVAAQATPPAKPHPSPHPRPGSPAPAKKPLITRTGWSILAGVVVAAIAIALIIVARQGDRVTPTADAGEPSATETQESAPVTEPSPPTDSTGVQPTSPTDATVSAPPTAAAGGDLGLTVPMTAPACDSTWVVFVGNATDPASYPADVQALLDSNPGANYTLTQGGCASMRQSLPDGTLIYAVWVGPYPDQAAACAAKADLGAGAYVKLMDDTTPPDQTWAC